MKVLIENSGYQTLTRAQAMVINRIVHSDGFCYIRNADMYIAAFDFGRYGIMDRQGIAYHLDPRTFQAMLAVGIFEQGSRNAGYACNEYHLSRSLISINHIFVA